MEKLITKHKSEVKDLEQRITDDLIISNYKLLPGRIFASCLLFFIVVAVMWNQVSHELLIIWGLLMTSAIIYADYNAKRFLQLENTGRVDQKWKNRLLYSPIVTGFLWGTGLIVFYNQGTVEQQIFFITVGLSLGMTGVFRGMYHIPFYYVYVTPVYIALIICFAMQGTYSYYVLAFLMTWTLIFLLSFSRMLNRTMRSEIRLRYEGDALTDELKQKTEEAQAMTMEKARFLAAASHDLRQPLHALSLFVDALKESGTDEERAANIQHISLSLEELIMLIDALLDLSRLDANAVKIECSHFDLAELLSDLEKEFRIDAYKKNLKFKVHSRQAIVNSDRLLLERILRNLISNAIRYTGSGGILLSSRQRGDKVLLQVWDTGIGIPEESREEVFVEFRQLHNSHRDRTQGLGLGLALVKRLCQLLGHSLILNSRVAKGSVFSISIDKGDINLLADKNTITETHSWELNGSRVLVIDDERKILHAMQASLSRWGCETITADSLDNAISQLNEKDIVPDLVISDLRLPGNKTGIEVIDAIREIYGQSIPGILVTGDAVPQRIKIARQSGYELLQKPVHPAHLRSVIQHYLKASKE